MFPGSINHDTRHLFTHSTIGRKNVVGVVDLGKSGQDFMGFIVEQPFKINKLNPRCVVVSSFAYQDEIVAYLSKRLNYKGQIITLYNKDDFEPFYSGLQQ